MLNDHKEAIALLSELQQIDADFQAIKDTERIQQLKISTIQNYLLRFANMSLRYDMDLDENEEE